MKKIIFATGNQNKMKEIREILADMDVEVVSMKEAGIHADIVEDGNSFEENAEIKAKTICEMTGEITLADDSGLEIDYLNKEPGIYSARYMGEDTSYRIKNGNLIQRLEGVPDEKRTARFVCAVAAAFPDGTVKTVRERMVLDMILYFICRNMDVPLQNFLWRKKIRSVTGGKPFVRSGTY